MSVEALGRGWILDVYEGRDSGTHAQGQPGGPEKRGKDGLRTSMGGNREGRAAVRWDTEDREEGFQGGVIRDVVLGPLNSRWLSVERRCL